jgi:hypothetical protein
MIGMLECNWFAEKTFRPDKHANIWSRVGIPHIKHTLDDEKHVYTPIEPWFLGAIYVILKGLRG